MGPDIAPIGSSRSALWDTYSHNRPEAEARRNIAAAYTIEVERFGSQGWLLFDVKDRQGRQLEPTQIATRPMEVARDVGQMLLRELKNMSA